MTVEVAAKKIGVSDERLTSWENGSSHPTMAQMRKVSNVYKRPLAVFYLSEIPTDFTPLRDFRRLPHDIPREYSPELNFLVRRVRERREWAAEIRRELNYEKLHFIGSENPGNEVSAVAENARNILDVSLDKQKTWKSPEQARKAWMDRFERLRLLVFQSSQVDLGEMRGFTMVDEYAPVITINSKDSDTGRIFTLMHEFAHLLIGSQGISNLTFQPRSGSVEDRTEVFCNGVAAELLVPRGDLKRTVRKGEISSDVERSIITLSKLYSVSREVIARRLADLGYITRALYREKRQQYLSELERDKRPKSGEIRIPRFRIVIRDNGKGFTKLVMSAYHENLIGLRDVSHLLNVKLKHLSQIEAEIFPS